MQNRLRFTILVLVLLCAAPSQAEQQRYIVRAPGGLQLVQNLCRLLGCSILRSLADPKSELFLVSGLDVLNPLISFPQQFGITNIELDLPVTLIPLSKQPRPSNGELTSLDGSPVWTGYATQPAAKIIRLPEAQSKFGVYGTSIVALIDTGIDGSHPALRYVVTPGYDFTANQPGVAPESAASQARTADSTAAVVDDPGKAFGHGTMVAGIVHLVAPRARIMPLKAFGSDGTAYLSDVLRSVYYAAQNGARVINMSFSMPGNSAELKAALDFAVSRQLICVGSAGNEGRETMVYPAGFDNTMGVASTNPFDGRSSFSNYGDRLVWVAAPGEEIVSTYPGGGYAAGWGTSFAAPFVSGTAALILDIEPGFDESAGQRAIGNAKPAGSGMGNGRLDVYQALDATKNLY